MSIRIVVADDHRIVREGLAALLACEADFELVGQAEDGLATQRRVRELQPDVLVTDVSMPGLNGIESVRRIHADYPAVKALCLSMHKDSRMVMGMLDAGAAGYVLKDSCFEELALAIRKVAAGQVYLSADLVGLVVHEARQRSGRAADAVSAPVLTPREREMVQLLSEGNSRPQIADSPDVASVLQCNDLTRTLESPRPEAPDPAIDIVLHFELSQNEEHARLLVQAGAEAIDLGERVHHYSLVTLARLRLRDAQRGVQARSQGWVSTSELARMLGVDQSYVNIQIFRGRQQVADALPPDLLARVLIERRRGELRIGDYGFTVLRGAVAEGGLLRRPSGDLACV